MFHVPSTVRSVAAQRAAFGSELGPGAINQVQLSTGAKPFSATEGQHPGNFVLWPRKQRSSSTGLFAKLRFSSQKWFPGPQIYAPQRLQTLRQGGRRDLGKETEQPLPGANNFPSSPEIGCRSTSYSLP